MIRNLIHTLSSRFLISLFNLALLFITTKWMGAENKGEISVLVLNLSIAAIFSGLFGGPSLVYLIPRYAFRVLFILNYAWSAITAVLLVSLISGGLIPSTLGGMDLFILALLESLVGANTMMLLGRERVKDHNLTQIIKVLLTVILLLVMRSMGEVLNFEAFVSSYRIGLFGAFLFSLFQLRGGNRGSHATGSIYETIRSALRYGSWVQVGNIAQLFNYRLSFFFLEFLIHPPEKAFIRIGIYSASLQVAEAVWQFARSVSTVQYAKVSNLSNKEEGLSISLTLTKVNAVVTTIGVAILCLLPSSVYEQIFGLEFGEVRSHVIFLAPGVIALSMSNAFSHFFAGVGSHRINAFSSIIGLTLTIVIGYPSIQYYGTAGAALTASVVYMLQTWYQFHMLKRDHSIGLSDLLIRKADLVLVKEVWRKIKP